MAGSARLHNRRFLCILPIDFPGPSAYKENNPFGEYVKMR